MEAIHRKSILLTASYAENRSLFAAYCGHPHEASVLISLKQLGGTVTRQFSDGCGYGPRGFVQQAIAQLSDLAMPRLPASFHFLIRLLRLFRLRGRFPT
jgi:hypothetical protein